MGSQESPCFFMPSAYLIKTAGWQIGYKGHEIRRHVIEQPECETKCISSCFGGVKQSKVLMVVSAMGRYPDPYATDTLLTMGSPLLSKEEKARLVSMGEQLSALTAASELLDAGISAYALPFHKSGIVTDYNYDYANVLSLSGRCIRHAFLHHDVVVAGGFIAQAVNGDVTTLGRGGSDFSAVLFADMLGVNAVDIFTDVDGVYNIDPKLSSFAVRYERLSYDEMLNMKVKVLP